MEYLELKEQIRNKMTIPQEFEGDRNLLELGLSSLKIMRLVNQWRRQGIRMSFGTLMENPTLDDWWLLIQRSRKKDTQKREKKRADKKQEAEIRKPFPLTDVQYAYWAGRDAQQTLGGVGCHAYMEFDGKNVDLARLESAWNQLQEHHAMLRACFLDYGMQEIEPVPYSRKIKVNNFSNFSEKDAKEAALLVRERLAHRKLQIEKGQVAGLEFTMLPGNKTRLHIDVDLLVADVQSLHILLRDLLAAYQGKKLPEESKNWNFAGYLEMEDKEEKEQARKYWSRRLQSLPKGPELPLAKRPEQIEKVVFCRRIVRIEKKEWENLQKRASKYRTTPAMVLLTAYAMVLERWSRNKRFLLNVPLFNRKTEYQGLEDVIADFTTLLLLEVNCEENPTFLTLLHRIQKQLHEDMKYTAYSGVQVQRDLAQLRGDASINAPIVFACNLDTPLVSDSFERTLGTFSYMISQTPQVWNDFQSYEDENGVQLTWDSVDELFPKNMIQDMMDSFERLLHDLGKNDWNQTFDVLPEHRKQAVDAVCDIAWPNQVQCLHTGFMENARKYPDQIALVDTEKNLSISYRNLKERAESVAAELVQRGVKGEPVAITLPRGYEQMVAVLGVLLSGNSYVPVSQGQPKERRKLIHEKTGVKYVITNEGLGRQIEWSDNMKIFILEEMGKEKQTVEWPEISAKDSAYIIMTSGSTGVPKGVEVAHGSAWNTIQDINKKYKMGKNDAVLAVSALDFDLSVYDIFGTLEAGGKIITIPESESKNPEYWLKMIYQYHVTHWNSVPILAEMLLVCWKAQRERKLPITIALLSGDWAPLKIANMFYEAVENGKLVVLGGATEASIWSNYQEVKLPIPANWKTIPYGRPLAGQAYRVVDEQGRDCPAWVEGELWIGGIGVAKGYRGDAVLSKQKFVNDSLGRWYRTGDNGLFWEDGTIEFCGRKDYQVKIKGHRIELGEIENVLNRIPGIKESIVCALDHDHRKNMLIAVVVKSDMEIREEDIKEQLKKKLPPYMIPAHIMFEKSLPITDNAKRNRKEILTWIQNRQDGKEEAEEKLTVEEEKLIDIWKKIFDQKNVSPRDNFFACGGDSLLAVRLSASIQEVFGIKVSVGTIFEYNTVRSLAGKIANMAKESFPVKRKIVPEEKARFEEFPTTEMQYAYWLGRQNVYVLGDVSSYCYYELFSENICLQQLEQSWNEVVSKNDALRLVFSKDGKTQRVLESVPYYKFKVHYVEKNIEESLSEIKSVRKNMSQQVIEASRWPLFDIQISVFQQNKYVVHIGVDNLILDARSVLLILHQWTQQYFGGKISYAPNRSFRDYVCADLRDRSEDSSAFWMQRIKRFPSYPLVPMKGKPEQVETQVFGRCSRKIKEGNWKAIRKITEQYKVTPSNLLLAIYAIVLGQMSGSSHFALNITIDKRGSFGEKLQNTTGDFTGNLLFEVNIREDQSLMELAKRLQVQLMQDMEHQDFSGIRFQRELSKYDRKKFQYGIPFVFTSTLGMVNHNHQLFGEVIYNITQTPQVFLDHQIQERGGILSLNWDYLEGLFDKQVIEDMADRVISILNDFAESGNGNVQIQDTSDYQEGIL